MQFDPAALDYFRARMTLIDLSIIALGVVLIAMQVSIRLTTSWRRLQKRADRNLLALRQAEIQLQIVAAMIELLPYMGILGTVWGLMNGMYVIQAAADPSIKTIAAKLAPALSSTFLGLLFAIVNNFLFNFLAAHVEELVAAYRLYYDQLTTPTAEVIVTPTTRRRVKLKDGAPSAALSGGKDQ